MTVYSLWSRSMTVHGLWSRSMTVHLALYFTTASDDGNKYLFSETLHLFQQQNQTQYQFFPFSSYIAAINPFWPVVHYNFFITMCSSSFFVGRHSCLFLLSLRFWCYCVCHPLKVKLVGISNYDIVDGKSTPILGLVWSIILRFQVSNDSNYLSHFLALNLFFGFLLSKWLSDKADSYFTVVNSDLLFVKIP